MSGYDSLSIIIGNKHLMTGLKGNSEFCFPETLIVPFGDVPQGEAEENIEGRGETKLTVSRGASQCFVIPPNSKNRTNYIREQGVEIRLV